MKTPRHTADGLGKNGFTLVEIMIAVTVIALLAAIGVPAFIQYRRDTQDSLFLNELRVMRDAFKTYYMKYGQYPPNQSTGIMPPEIAGYLPDMDWAKATPIGGQWDWEGVPWTGAGVSVRLPERDPDAMERLDALVDDGNLSTGAFRRLTPAKYTFLLQEPAAGGSAVGGNGSA
jgi:type IV pilus assembly protein PilA